MAPRLVEEEQRARGLSGGGHGSQAPTSPFPETGVAFRGLHAAFFEHARLHPLRTALTLGKRTLAYGAMAELALRWAAVLAVAAGGRPRRVGVYASRSEVGYVGVLAALASGATFVPLNPRFPVERTRAMIASADLDVIVCDVESARQLPLVLAGAAGPVSVVVPGCDPVPLRAVLAGRVYGPEDLLAAAPLSDLPVVTAADVAYLLFTSGSTGAPKGVPVCHGNVRAFLDASRARYDFGPDDRFSQTFDQTFDLSVFDLFMAWECGASVVVPQPLEVLAPVRFIRDNQVTVWFSVPSVATGLVKRGALVPGSLPTLRWSLFCGEGLPREAAERWQAAAPSSTLENLYGPTELTIACSVYRWRGPESVSECVQELVPIGQPYPDLVHRVVDSELADVAEGEPGELCVGGPQTFPGYWQAPALDEAKFFERLRPDGVPVRFYRTGDIVRWRPWGYVYLGRNDQQVKIGGYRIELGEVEAAFRHAGCVEVAALAWPDPQRPESIVAAICGGADPAVVTAAAQALLPAWMIPRVVRVVDPMPLNANGKVDRAAVRVLLTEILEDPGDGAEPTDPRVGAWFQPPGCGPRST